MEESCFVVGRSPNEGGSSNCNDQRDFSRMKVVEKRLKIVELVLRCVICLFGLLVAVLVGSASEVRVIFTIEKTATFTDMGALVFLVIANVMAAGYSVVQGGRCIMGLFRFRESLLLSKSLAWAIFSCDQVMAYVTVAAAAAALQSAALGKWGQQQMEWMKLCDLYGKFCNQASAGVAASLIVSFNMILLSSISAFYLFRLYGTKGKIREGK